MPSSWRNRAFVVSAALNALLLLVLGIVRTGRGGTIHPVDGAESHGASDLRRPKRSQVDCVSETSRKRAELAVLSARMVRTAPAFDLFEMSDAAEPARAELLRSKLESMNGVDGVAVDCRLLACRVKLAVSGDAGSPDAEQRIQTIIRRSFPGAAFSVRTPHDGRNESGLRLSELYVKVPSWESGLQ